LRWALRYSVVPRNELDPAFFDEVIKEPLEREIEKAQHDNPSDTIPEGLPNPWKYVKDGKVQRSELWDALRKYQGERSWVTVPDETVYLSPEFVQPMRWLLRGQPVFRELHERAISYFNRQSEGKPAREWARWQAESVYHRFQIEGQGAGEYWLKLLDHPLAA